MFSKVFLKKWLSNEDLNKKKFIHEKCYKLNEAHTPVADEKKRFVVIDGRVRQRHPYVKINFKKEIDPDVLLAAYAINVLNADSEINASDAKWQSYSCFLASVQCITNKLIKLNCLLASNKYALQSLLDCSWDNNGVIQNQNYSILRCERQQYKHVGSAII